MTDKNNLKNCNSKYWVWESFWKGFPPLTGKTSQKKRNCNYLTLDLYGFTAHKHSIKN